jgi:hypothetical protein
MSIAFWLSSRPTRPIRPPLQHLLLHVRHLLLPQLLVLLGSDLLYQLLMLVLLVLVLLKLLLLELGSGCHCRGRSRLVVPR